MMSKHKSGGQCSALGCSMRRGKNPFCEVKTFYFPRNPIRRAAWALAVGRKYWYPTDNSLLCNFHFITGKPSSDPDHPDYIPSIFSYDVKPVKGGRKKPLYDHDMNYDVLQHFIHASTIYRNYENGGTSFTSEDNPTEDNINKDETNIKITDISSVLSDDNSLNNHNELQFLNVGNEEEQHEETIEKVTSDPQSSNIDHNKEAAGSSSTSIENGVLENPDEERNVKKRRKVDSVSPPRIIVENVPIQSCSVDKEGVFGQYVTSDMKAIQSCSVDREDIFGQYVASEMKALKENPLLYLQTKQSILQILTSANFELINPE